jgi:hypothetical protein
MKPETIDTIHDTPFSQCLYMAIELSHGKWLLGFTIGFGQAPRLRSIMARDLKALAEEIELAKKRFNLAADIQVRSCYEAGRDGFWLHRYLAAQGVDNRVVDSASIEVNRRKRRAKTDRLDVRKLLTMLMRYHNGEQKLWSIVHVPSPEEEDQRQLHRELMTLIAERTRHINCIKGLLVSQGSCCRSRQISFADWRKCNCGMARSCRWGCMLVWRESTSDSRRSSSRFGSWSTAVWRPCAPRARPLWSKSGNYCG